MMSALEQLNVNWPLGLTRCLDSLNPSVHASVVMAREWHMTR
jgi:hypothetical protein